MAHTQAQTLPKFKGDQETRLWRLLLEFAHEEISEKEFETERKKLVREIRRNK